MTTKIITSKSAWEKFIDTVSPIALFQRWDWGEVQILCKAPVVRFGYYEGKSLIGVAQAVVVPAKRGNFLHIRHGPVIRNWTVTNGKKILAHLKKIAQEQKCVGVRISPCIESSSKHTTMFHAFGGIPAAIHAMDAECSWLLDLDLPLEQLLANMRKTTRYEIRRAQKAGVTIEKSTDPKSLIVFFDLYNKTAKRHGFVEHQSIQEEFNVFAAEGNALHIIGRVNGKAIASAIILFVGNEAIYHHGASESSSIPASYLVQWESIQEAKKRGMEQYNFWGIAPTDDINHPWHGLSLFKKGFGGKARESLHAYDFTVSWKYWLLYLVEWTRKRIKGYS